MGFLVVRLPPPLVNIFCTPTFDSFVMQQFILKLRYWTTTMMLVCSETDLQHSFLLSFCTIGWNRLVPLCKEWELGFDSKGSGSDGDSDKSCRKKDFYVVVQNGRRNTHFTTVVLTPYWAPLQKVTRLPAVFVQIVFFL